MENDDFFKKSNFSSEWINLGIITPEVLEEIKQIHEEELEEIRQECEKDGTLEQYKWRFSIVDDEHSRWRAFTRFLERNKNLPPETMKALYELGKSDPDDMMGGSMMRQLLDRKDCPLELLETAANSDKKFLVKAANNAIERRRKNDVKIKQKND